jgi:hypothetical protein
MAECGLNTADAALLQLFTRRTGALLRWQKKRGICDQSKTRSMAGSIFGRSRFKKAWTHVFNLDRHHARSQEGVPLW